MLAEVDPASIKPLQWDEGALGEAFGAALDGNLGSEGTAIWEAQDPNEVTSKEYVEHVSIGAGAAFVSASRWVGGENDGLFNLSCSGGDDKLVAVLEFTEPQANAVLAAHAGEAALDLEAVVAAQSRANSANLPLPVSPVATCDTAAVDLLNPEAGQPFSCTLMSYSQSPDFTVEYQTTDEPPFFVPTSDGIAEESPATDDAPESPDELDSCEVAPEFGPAAEDCAEAQALLSACEDLASPLTVATWDRIGITEWETEGTTSAVTSTDGESEPAVLSCGAPSNGVHVRHLHEDVWESAEKGWGVKVMAVTCSAKGQVLDTMQQGESVATCTVNFVDSGAPGYAFISITDSPPFYRIDLGE